MSDRTDVWRVLLMLLLLPAAWALRGIEMATCVVRGHDWCAYGWGVECERCRRVKAVKP